MIKKTEFIIFSENLLLFPPNHGFFARMNKKRRDALLQNILQFDRISCRNTSKKKKVQMTFRPSAQLFLVFVVSFVEECVFLFWVSRDNDGSVFEIERDSE